jgi:hypothetical protein
MKGCSMNLSIVPSFLNRFSQENVDENGTWFRADINGHQLSILRVNYRGKVDYSMYDGCLENHVFVGEREEVAKQKILEFLGKIYQEREF